MYRVIDSALVIGPWGAVASRSRFFALLDYSCSLPTGTRIGKVWRRYVCTDDRCRCKQGFRSPSPGYCPGYWLLGEYHDIGRTDRVGIRWYRLRWTHDVAIKGHVDLARWYAGTPRGTVSA